MGRVGVFSTLTNAYAIVAVGASENFYRCVEARSPAQGVLQSIASANRQWSWHTDMLATAFSKPNFKTSYPFAMPPLQALE